MGLNGRKAFSLTMLNLSLTMRQMEMFMSNWVLNLHIREIQAEYINWMLSSYQSY